MKDNARRKKKASSILITTSHNPTHFLRRVCRLLSYSLPLSSRINRGSLNRKELLNYCWNNKINWLFIVKQSQEVNIIDLECTNLSLSTEPLNAFIKLKDFFFPQKGDNETRISVNQMSLNYSPEIPNDIIDLILPFNELCVKDNKAYQESSNLSLNFSKYAEGKLEGNVAFTGKNKLHELFKFTITIPVEEE
jgi:rRNA maturation protein Rpf1